MSSPEQECLALASRAVTFAIDRLGDVGGFLPYGMVLNAAGQLEMVGAMGDDSKGIAQFAEAYFVSGAANGDFKATALIEDRFFVLFGRKQNAIIATICHTVNQYAVRYLYPYVKSMENSITVGSEIRQPITNSVFPAPFAMELMFIPRSDEWPITGLNVQLADTIEIIKQRFKGIDMLSTTEDDAEVLQIPQLGFNFHFKDSVLSSIVLKSPFVGNVDGVSIGDTVTSLETKFPDTFGKNHLDEFNGKYLASKIIANNLQANFVFSEDFSLTSIGLGMSPFKLKTSAAL
jgi:hypothetical protein